MRNRLSLPALICLIGVGIGVGVATVAGAQTARPADSGINVRVLGRFLMSGTVTVAVGIPGEQPGERVARTWRIRPDGCAESDCARVVLVRNRGAQRESKLTLRRIGATAYRGTGSFWVPLKCLGRTDAHGSLAPYVVTLTVTQWTQRGAIRYATALNASYANTERSDRTRCPLGIAHDAARYTGVLKSALPGPPPAPAPAPAPVPAPTTTTAPAPTPPVPTSTTSTTSTTTTTTAQP